VVFRFKEQVRTITRDTAVVTGVKTQNGTYAASVVIDAAGPSSRDLSQTLDCDVPVMPESHEAGITEPVEMFCPAMVVDLRPAEGSKNYYFYQNKHGQIVFCITPEPPIIGTDHRETSVFLPQVCTRMVGLLPRLKNLRIRRVWRGLYPMTSDGSPLVGWNRQLRGLLHVAGMCGQGFMLGPGLGEVVARMVSQTTTDVDRIILDKFSLYRDQACEVEALK
ncbi:MAG: FAD-binding oxidoreductase, partial [Desulfosarcina sp.]